MGTARNGLLSPARERELTTFRPATSPRQSFPAVGYSRREIECLESSLFHLRFGTVMHNCLTANLEGFASIHILSGRVAE